MVNHGAKVEGKGTVTCVLLQITCDTQSRQVASAESSATILIDQFVHNSALNDASVRSMSSAACTVPFSLSCRF